MQSKLKSLDEYKNSIIILVQGYINISSTSVIPDSIIDLIIQWHGFYDIHFASNILNINDKVSFMALICDHLQQNIQLTRIFSGTINGFSASTFHGKCDNKGATIILVKSEYDGIFGGYSSISWTSDGTTKMDKNAFLFEYYPSKEIHKQLNDNGWKAVYHWPHYLGAFSPRCDLLISNGCNNNRNSYAVSKYYKFKSGSHLVGDISNLDDNNVKAKNFSVKDIEVFSCK